jgi:hypothetical protein
MPAANSALPSISLANNCGHPKDISRTETARMNLPHPPLISETRNQILVSPSRNRSSHTTIHALNHIVVHSQKIEQACLIIHQFDSRRPEFDF